MFVTSLFNFKRVFIGKCKSFSTSDDIYYTVLTGILKEKNYFPIVFKLVNNCAIALKELLVT